jgi:hypothetical protein
MEDDGMGTGSSKMRGIFFEGGDKLFFFVLLNPKNKRPFPSSIFGDGK